jgi:endonuclease YncB( thermonuclease family)
MRRTLAIITALIFALSPARAESTAPGWFPPSPSAVYQTGDSWSDHGVTYRLYGVQSCLRGTSFTNAHGLKRDCGEASLAMLIALTRDLRPQCYEAMSLPQANTIFVFCIAQPTQGTAAGSRIDLGTALISTGYAFAALRPDGTPVHAPYLVAQTVAAKSHAGLWAFPDLPERAGTTPAPKPDFSATAPAGAAPGR